MLHCIAPNGLKLNYLYKTSTCHRQLLLKATHWEYKAIILIVLVHIKLWKSLLFSWMKKDTWFYEVWYLSAKNARTGEYILRPFKSRSTNSSWLRYFDPHIGEWTGSFLVQVNSCRLFGTKSSTKLGLTYAHQMSVLFDMPAGHLDKMNTPSGARFLALLMI